MPRQIDKEARSGFTFSAVIDFEAITPTTEHPFFLFKNPASSGTLLMVTHMNFATDSTVTRSFFKTYASPTITADGTAIAENNMLIKTSPPTADATAFKNPTISANGTLLSMKLLAASSPSTGQNRFIWLEENNSLLVTVQNNVASVKTFVQVYWNELQ